MIPKFLQPEVVPYSSVEIVIAGLLAAAPAKPICAWCPDFEPFHPRNKGASHSMCAVCVARYEASAGTR